MKKIVIVVLLIAAISVPFIAFDVLPVIGDPDSAPNSHVSDYYIENAAEECNSPNMVTAVIVDYRAFDTMFETTVMFLAGAAVVLILASRPRRRMVSSAAAKKMGREIRGRSVYNTVNKDVMISLIEPIILIYAVYVLFHGEVSLGGGFQAGALIGMTYLLDVMVGKRKEPLMNLSKFKSAALAGLGPFIYALTGLVSVFAGGMYLEYNKLPLPVHQAELHSIGITAVEIGVTIGVAGTIITIINSLLERISFDDDND